MIIKTNQGQESGQSIGISRRGFMLILSSPSGAGKTTISRQLLEKDQEIELSISVTTRPRRPGEVHGRDYFFMSQEEFQEMVNTGALLEHAHVFGNNYGTPHQAIENSLSKGKDVLFDIEWQGTQQLKQKARDDVVSIFILPPSIEELEKRLYRRGQDDASVVKNRMQRAGDEMSHWPEYDYIIINYDLKQSTDSVYAILQAERLKRARQLGLAEFVNNLRK